MRLLCLISHRHRRVGPSAPYTYGCSTSAARAGVQSNRELPGHRPRICRALSGAWTCLTRKILEDADVHRPGVQGDATVVAKLSGVESHRGLLSKRLMSPTSLPSGYAGRGPRISIQALQQTPASGAVSVW
jgi:hypothetical protein